MDEFVVTIDQFDGPLDLMLHLIKEKELDIFDLDITVLTDQYIDYIHQMEALKLDIASEYLVELATMIEYKSKLLLPKQEDLLDDSYEQSNEQDLVKRLIEYQKYKEISAQFNDLYQERALLHEKAQSEMANSFIKVDENYQNTSPYELIKAMKRVLNRYSLANPYEVSITTARITVDERQTQLKNRIESMPAGEVFTLETCMEDCHDIYDVVVTFLSILTLVNENYIYFSVKKDTVYFKKGVKDE